MWTTEQLGKAVWTDEGGRLYFDARGGSTGVTILDKRAADAPVTYLALQAVDRDTFPVAAEQFVRGDRWHINYPQHDGSYALRLAIEPLESAVDRIVLEMTVSIQTDLLDTHPTIDIDVPCRDIDFVVPGDAGDVAAHGSGSAPISIANTDDYHVSILLGPHDSPFTTNHSAESVLRLRLFGEFLEKGVIRKARPWIVIDRSAAPHDRARLEACWRRLCDSPLPLTP